MRSMSSRVWARERKAASNWEGWACRTVVRRPAEAKAPERSQACRALLKARKCCSTTGCRGPRSWKTARHPSRAAPCS